MSDWTKDRETTAEKCKVCGRILCDCDQCEREKADGAPAICEDCAELALVKGGQG
jgi:hypothetical protein